MEIILTIFAILILAETTFLFVAKLRQRTLKVARGSLLLDTSALMDGRIVDVAKTGIITAEIIIPRSVVAEMQLLADKADSDKRARARAGLDNVKKMRDMENISVAIVQDGLAKTGVDDKLLELAQKYGAEICTTDYNLNKVAKTLDITVVNVNELAQTLRAVVLPGETVEISLVQAGANRDQGVGYLDDGTMVVVEDARRDIGEKVRVEIIRSLQTEAGRMMFAKKISFAAQNSRDKAHENLRESVRKSMKKVHSEPLREQKKSRENSFKNSINSTKSLRENSKNFDGNFAQKTGNSAEKNQTNSANFAPKISAAPSFHSENLKNLNAKNAQNLSNSPNKNAQNSPADKFDKFAKTENARNFANSGKIFGAQNSKNPENAKNNFAKNQKSGAKNSAEDSMVALANKK